MTDLIQVSLEPLGRSVHVKEGTPLKNFLHEYGVEFPCGGKGKCQGCRVEVLRGALSCDAEGKEQLAEQLTADNVFLACQCRITAPVTLRIGQWQGVILTEHRPFDFQPIKGRGIAIDVGTTTLVAQLLDLSTGSTLAVKTELNPQAVHGSDVMSRVQFGMDTQGLQILKNLIQKKTGELIGELLATSATLAEEIQRVVLVGNTVMHHLFCGIDPAPLSHKPFEPATQDAPPLTSTELNWGIPPDIPVQFLPWIGGFVGSDVLAGILATSLVDSNSPRMLVDLGTNGEIVIGDRTRLICASTAAGPAFEAGRISMGMRAATGAISAVHADSEGFVCKVIGDVTPRGICGSGLVDAVSAALEQGLILKSGSLSDKNKELPLADPVKLTQQDIRELQLAKAALAAAFQILMRQFSVTRQDIDRVYLAGAFGNYIDIQSACNIGLFDVDKEIIEPVGNTALLGAKMALFSPKALETLIKDTLARTEHISLATDPEFMEIYVEKMAFPAR